ARRRRDLRCGCCRRVDVRARRGRRDRRVNSRRSSMPTVHEVIPREYRDSVALMQLSAALAKMKGIKQASALMGTDNNLSLLRQAGMDLGKLSVAPNDLLIVVQGDEGAVGAALKEAKARLSSQGQAVNGSAVGKIAPHSIAMALADHADANLAMIS